MKRFIVTYLGGDVQETFIVEGGYITIKGDIISITDPANYNTIFAGSSLYYSVILENSVKP